MTKNIIVILIIILLGAFIGFQATMAGANYTPKSPAPSPTVKPSATPLATPTASPVASATPSIVPTSTPVPTDPPTHVDQSDNLGCSVNDCSGNQVGSPPQSAFISTYDGSKVGAK